MGETSRRSGVRRSSPSLSRSRRPIESMRVARSSPKSGVSACGSVISACGSACVVVTPHGLCQARSSAPPSGSLVSTAVTLRAWSDCPSSSSGVEGAKRSPSSTLRPALVTRCAAIAASAPRRESPERSATRTLTRMRSVSECSFASWRTWPFGVVSICGLATPWRFTDELQVQE